MARLTPSALSSTLLAAEHADICERLERTRVDESLTFDASLYDPKAVALVLSQWKRRMLLEHRSSTVFSQLFSQLFEANASLDAQVAMLRMAQDELRHTGTCAEVITALGGEPEVEADLTLERLASHAGTSPEERALRNVIYTTSCCEMIACARFVATLDTTTNPFVRQALRRLLSDEKLHGQFGFHYLEAWRDWLEAHRAVVRSLERYLTHAFAVLESELAPVGPFPTLGESERALGAEDPRLAREVFYATMEGAVVPGLARFGLDAETAWRNRGRLTNAGETVMGV